MKNNKLITYLILGVFLTFNFLRCNIDPEFHSEVVPDNFYTSQEAVWERFNRPFTHWRWYVAENDARWFLQELGTDEFCLPSRGSDWFNGGVFQQFHHHEYKFDMTAIETGWTNYGMGIALAWDALEDLEKVNFDALGFEKGTRESMVSQHKALVASFYLDGLDLFGGVPLYTSTKSEVKGRSTAQETFEFIDALLEEAIGNILPKETLGEMENGNIRQATVAALRAKLYFGAKSYINKEMYAETAIICQDIIDGKYGKYELDTDWTNIFGFTNEYSPEIIWTVPSQNAKMQTGQDPWPIMVPYNYRNFIGGMDSKNAGGNNGLAIIPSLDPEGNLYQYKLGNAFAKFNDADVRKQNHIYEGGGKYRGMFIVGELINPLNPSWVCVGGREYKGKVLTIVDQIAYFAKVGTDSKYPNLASLESTIAHAEESSGVRLIKRSPRPNIADSKLSFNPDVPIIRLAEIYYMLAECKMRAGDLSGAAQLINKVRSRYFENGDPNPVTAQNLDKYRMLDEWMQEFIGEGRRRIDLIRWDAYVTEDWWDHKATNNKNFNLFPIHYSIMGANNLLTQNPGY